MSSSGRFVGLLAEVTEEFHHYSGIIFIGECVRVYKQPVEVYFAELCSGQRVGHQQLHYNYVGSSSHNSRYVLSSSGSVDALDVNLVLELKEVASSLLQSIYLDISIEIF